MPYHPGHRRFAAGPLVGIAVLIGLLLAAYVLSLRTARRGVVEPPAPPVPAAPSAVPAPMAPAPPAQKG